MEVVKFLLAIVPSAIAGYLLAKLVHGIGNKMDIVFKPTETTELKEEAFQAGYRMGHMEGYQKGAFYVLNRMEKAVVERLAKAGKEDANGAH